MKRLYLECSMGAAGDMLMAALLELLPDPDGFIQMLNRLGIPHVQFERHTVEQHSITGCHVTVTVHGQQEQTCDLPAGHAEHHPLHTGDAGHAQGHHHHHHGPSWQEVLHTIERLALPASVREDAKAVYRSIVEAESKVHHQPVEQVHLHEVGAWDAVADIVGVCALFDRIGAKEIFASPVHLGSGQVRCAHGVLPVPAPATALLLEGIPCYTGTVIGELCTPTGAALLRHFVGSFGPMPMMTMQKVGVGMGTKEFSTLNCLRAFLGEPASGGRDQVMELSCNLDDMTPEALGYAQQALLDQGALDVFFTPIQMKKNRPAQLLCCLCRPEDAERLAICLLRHTTTFGVRSKLCDRWKLETSFGSVETPYGPLKVKRGTGYGVQKQKYEYDDLAAMAQQQQISLQELLDAISHNPS